MKNLLIILIAILFACNGCSEKSKTTEPPKEEVTLIGATFDLVPHWDGEWLTFEVWLYPTNVDRKKSRHGFYYNYRGWQVNNLPQTNGKIETHGLYNVEGNGHKFLFAYFYHPNQEKVIYPYYLDPRTEYHGQYGEYNFGGLSCYDCDGGLDSLSGDALHQRLEEIADGLKNFKIMSKVE